MYKICPTCFEMLNRANANRVRAYTPKQSAIVSHKRNSFQLELGRIVAKATPKKL